MSPPSNRALRTFVLRTSALLALVLSATACGPNHIGPFTPRERAYSPGPYAQTDPSARPAPGSLFSDAQSGYFEDARGAHVGDILSIRIDESADAQGDSTTNLNRKSSMSAGVDTLFGLVTALKGAGIDPTKIAQFASESSFEGQGATARKGKLAGSITVRVRKAMPNGDLFLEGTKVVLINNEEYHLYVSGLVRPRDIERDNTVPSSRIADAQIEFTGRGDVADQQRKGWLTRIIDAVNPF